MTTAAVETGTDGCGGLSEGTISEFSAVDALTNSLFEVLVVCEGDSTGLFLVGERNSRGSELTPWSPPVNMKEMSTGIKDFGRRGMGSSNILSDRTSVSETGLRTDRSWKSCSICSSKCLDFAF